MTCKGGRVDPHQLFLPGPFLTYIPFIHAFEAIPGIAWIRRTKGKTLIGILAT